MSETHSTNNVIEQKGQQLATLPEMQRLAIVENWKLKIIRDPELVQQVTQLCERFGSNLPGDVREFKSQQSSEFSNKLQRVVEKMSKQNGNSFVYPVIGESLYSVESVNTFLTKNNLRELLLPESISGEALIKLSELRYMFESEVFDHIIGGFVDKVLTLEREGKLPEVNIQCLLRDGRVFYAAAQAYLQANPDLEADRYQIFQSYVNRAIVAPLAKDKDAIDYPPPYKITTQQAKDHLQALGITKPGEVPFTLILDTGSLGSLMMAIKDGIGEEGKIAAIYLTAENVNIPSYVSFLETGSWYVDLNNADLLRIQQLARDYAEDHFGSYTKRPESFGSRRDSLELVVPVVPPNDATSILSWVSLQAAKDIGKVYGLLRQTSPEMADSLPKKSLDFLYNWWINVVQDENYPNIAFANWPAWDEKDSFLSKWHAGILEELGLL